MMERLKDRRRAMQDTQESTLGDLDNTTQSAMKDPNNSTWVRWWTLVFFTCLSLLISNLALVGQFG